MRGAEKGARERRRVGDGRWTPATPTVCVYPIITLRGRLLCPLLPGRPWLVLLVRIVIVRSGQGSTKCPGISRRCAGPPGGFRFSGRLRAFPGHLGVPRSV